MNKRNLILLGFLVLFSVFSMRHFVLGGGVAASVDALCPFGGFETLWTLIATGSLVPRILISSLVLAIGVLITVVLFRRGFCGYICPFGAVQEFLGKLKKNKIVIKFRQAVYLKYVVLVAILVGTAITGTLIWRSFDPFMTFFHFGKGVFWEVEPGHMVGFLVTLAVLVLSVFNSRFFCKYICPLGATMNIFNWFNFTKISRDHTCIDCKKCDKVCPMDVKVSDVNFIQDKECINCNECVKVCPKDSLAITLFKKKVSPIVYASVLIAVFFFVILGAKAIGVWSSVPNVSIESDGVINPDLIKGWMTLNEVAIESQINVRHFVEDFNFPQDIDLDTPLKDIGKKYDMIFETSEVREYVKNFKHGNHATEETFGTDCPWNLVNDPYPGKCGLYRDVNNDGLCDLSQ